MEAFTDAPIYARTNGYVRRWFVDIGAHVKARQLLAEIETPEVDQQLGQARAQFATAQADYKLAKSTAERWQNLRKTDSVSQQETDEKVGDMESKSATMEASRANVRRLEETQSFQKIYAPFSGVITARNVDIGDLINAGSNGTGSDLFRLEAIRQMRVYIQVPQLNSRSAVPGMPAELAIPEMPGKRFAGHVVRTSDAMDPASRTLRVEVDVDNPDGVLMPSEYVEVHLKVSAPTNSLIVPVNALLFRSEGISAAVVRADHVVLQPIIIGRDFGDELEVTSGLAPDDQIVINPPDSIAAGQKVRLAPAGAQQ
jgi:RND family efflux transporter MFP subunit